MNGDIEIFPYEEEVDERTCGAPCPHGGDCTQTYKHPPPHRIYNRQLQLICQWTTRKERT